MVMATYMELFGAKEDSNLQDKVTIAVVIAAENIRIDPSPPGNQVQRLVWAKDAMTDPIQEAKRMLWAMLAANKDADLSQIIEASDSTIQTKVDNVIDLFAGTS
jgi:hypothetical protein